MNTQLKVVGALLALSCGSANAALGTIQIGGTAVPGQGKVSSQSGVCNFDFNSGNAINTCGITYSAGPSHFVSGTNTQHAAPADDTSIYFTVGPSAGTSATITMTTAANYFGFYAGSLDAYNLVQFFMNGMLVDSFTGTQINAVAFPMQPTDGNQAQAQYIDYFLPTGAFYNSIVYSSTQDAFETDNHAIGLATPAPEPTPIALLGIGAMALLVRRRRKD